MSTEDIYNYRKVDELTITGGQPTESQIRAAAGDGLQVVVNLATIDPRYSLEDEGGLADSLGLEYHHIPVVWEQPTAADYSKFVKVMNQIVGKRVLIHCAANYRVTAFYSLYAMQSLGWSEAQANDFRASVWTRKYPAWDEFIDAMKKKIKAGTP